MTVISLDSLIIDTETQLGSAIDAVIGGDMVDLTNLAPQLERLCEMAILEKARNAAERLARLIAQLDALERLLRERIAATASPRPDAKRATQLYRSNTPSPDADRAPPIGQEQDAL